MYRYLGCFVVVFLICANGFGELSRAYAGPGTQRAETNATTVTFQVVFFCGIPTCHVTGLDAGDFEIRFSGTLSSPRIVSITETGQWYSVVVETGPGDGNLWLYLHDDDSIVNENQEPLGGPGAGNGDVDGMWSAFHIDRTPPRVASITPTVSLTSAVEIEFRVLFSESVTGVDVTDFTTNDVNVCPTYPWGCGPPLSTVPGYWPVAVVLRSTRISGHEFSVVIGAGKSDGPLRLYLVDDDSITDPADNTLAGAAGAADGSFRDGASCEIDRSRPHLSMMRVGPAITNAQRVEFLATAGTEAVRFYPPRPQIASRDSGLADVSLESMTCLDCDGDGWGHTWKLVVFTGTGSGAIVWSDSSSLNPLWPSNGNFQYCQRCSGCTPTCTSGCTPLCWEGALWIGAHDRLGWTAIADRSDSVTIDRSMPAVLSITPVQSSSATRSAKAASPQFQVLFSESVSGVDAGDFAASGTGEMSLGKIVAVTRVNETTWLVTADPGNGSRGLFSVRVADDDSIIDAAGNPLGGIGVGNGAFNAGQPVVFGTPPTVMSVTLLDRNPARHLDVVRFAFDFSARVTAVSGDDFRIFEHGITRSTIAGVEPGTTPMQWIVSVPLAPLSSEVAVRLADDDSIVDDYGLPLGGVGAGNGDYLSPAYIVAEADPIPALDPYLLAALVIALAMAGGVFMRR